MQRLHEDDLSGHLLDNAEWQHLSLPAIANDDCRIQIGPTLWKDRIAGEVLHPEREPLTALVAIKTEMGSLTFSAQYQQSPIPAEGNLVKREWFKWYDNVPTKTATTIIVQSWDTALATGSSNDYSVCTTWSVNGSDYHLIDALWKRLAYPDLKRAISSMATRFDADTILIEEAGAGMSVIQDFEATLTE